MALALVDAAIREIAHPIDLAITDRGIRTIHGTFAKDDYTKYISRARRPKTVGRSLTMPGILKKPSA
jgi:hypothetical protein